MLLKLELITQSREDLFDITHALFSAMETRLFADAQQPVIISVNGAFASGKKIVTDALREKLLGTSFLTPFAGKNGYDEFWLGQHHGKPLEIDYIDLGFGGGYGHDDLKFIGGKKLEDAFLKARTHGGVTILQNKPEEYSNFDGGLPLPSAQAGVNVWIENALHAATETHNSKLKTNSDLSEAFKLARRQLSFRQADWLRYLQIDVADQRLTTSPAFCTAAEKLKKTGLKSVQNITAGNAAHNSGQRYFRP